MEENQNVNFVVDLSKNDLIDSILERFYKTFKLTEDSDNVVSERRNEKIRNYIYKNFIKSFKYLDLFYKGYIKSQEKDNTTYFYKVKQNMFWTKFFNKFKFWNLFKKKNKTSDKSDKGEKSC